MNTQNLAKSSPATRRLIRRLLALAFVVVLAAGVVVINGALCSLYALVTSRPAAAPVMVEGELCAGAEHCAPAILISGTVNGDMVERIRLRAGQPGTGSLWVCLRSAGGDATAARTELPANVRTCVVDVISGGGTASPSLCASACAWLWLAAPERVIGGASRLGFHRAYVHDCWACAPANWGKAWRMHAEGLLRAKGTQDEEGRRRVVREAMAKGPTEAFYVGPAEAVRLGFLAGGETLLKPVFRECTNRVPTKNSGWSTDVGSRAHRTGRMCSMKPQNLARPQI